MSLPSPFPYFGSKSAAAPLIWSALGNTDNVVDPFCGSCAIHWRRPRTGKIITLNDAFGAIPNFLRAVQRDPGAVADAASWPVDECMMHARHRWLVDKMDDAFVERLMTEPEFYDAEIAGWWCWGQSIWIGAGWCAKGFKSEGRKRPALAGNGGSPRPRHGVGIHRQNVGGKVPFLGGTGMSYGNGIFRRKVGGQLPSLSGSDGSGVGYGRGVFASGRREDLLGYFEALSSSLRQARITCGDWRRVVTPAVTTSHGLTGVVLDPPYGEAAGRTPKLYSVDSLTVAADVRDWAVENGDNPLLRIVLCGYDGEHEMPPSWRAVRWKTNGGYGNQDGENANAGRETLWLSPHCLRGAENCSQAELFGDQASRRAPVQGGVR